MILGKNLNHTFGHVYVKNVAEAKSRLDSFIRTASSIELEYEVFSAIRGDRYVPIDYQIKLEPHLYPVPANQYLAGNCYTTISIILDAMRHRYESIVICDDDTIFYNVNLEYIKNHLPEHWNVINFGSLESVPTPIASENEIVPTIELLTDVKEFSGSHCVAIHESCYYNLLLECCKFDVHGYFGDRLLYQLAEENRLIVHKMKPDITYQERNVLQPYVIE